MPDNGVSGGWITKLPNKFVPWALLLSGALAATGQAPIGAWPLTLVGLYFGLSLILDAPSAKGAALRGWLLGGGYFIVAMNWIVEPFLVDIARHGWMAPFGLLFMSFGLALFWGAGALAARRFGGNSVFALAFGICLGELARSYVLTGFPWALVGHVWIATPIAQGAAWGGVHALSLLTFGLVATVIAFGARGAVGAVLCFGAVWGGGLLRLAQPYETLPDALQLRVIQPNAAQHLKWDPELIPMFFRRQLAQTSDPATPKPDVVIWPETSIAYALNGSGTVQNMIAEAASGAPVIAGHQQRKGDGVFNSLVVIGTDGALTHEYDKHHLVPFGEYMPLQSVFARLGVFGLAMDQFGYQAGPGAQVLDLGVGGKVLPLICYEAIFPQDVRAAFERPDWIVQITNDAWFGGFSGPYQHLAQARFRAIEMGLPFVRSANTGVSAVIDARGQLVDALALNREGVLNTALPPALPKTLYAKTGDWPIGALLVLLFGAISPRLRRRV